MIRPFALGAALALTVTLVATVYAHEGHIHKIMGTVSTRHENHLEVKATDGKTAVVTLNDATKILRGKSKATADTIKPGERIVVSAKPTKGKDGTTTLIAVELRLPVAEGSSTR